MWAGVLGRTRLAGCCPSIGAHFFRFSHSVAASIHGTGGQPEPRVDRRARARVVVGLHVPCTSKYGFTDKRVDANFQDDGYTTWRGYALSYMYEITVRYRSGYITRLILSSSLISLMTHVDHEAHAG